MTKWNFLIQGQYISNTSHGGLYVLLTDLLEGSIRAQSDGPHQIAPVVAGNRTVQEGEVTRG